MTEEKRVGVGIGVAVFKDGKILLGLRHNAHGEGSWCLPGGHLDYGETFEECAQREVFEEAGLKIKNLRTLCVNNDLFEEEQKHYVTIGMAGDWDSGEIEIKEPEKFNPAKWFSLDALPQPLFMPTGKIVEALKARKG
ncbi:MAG: NUDIX domain-containing protein [Candidatus Micrarchaeota archaeon]